jgi:hypothetical protein
MIIIHRDKDEQGYSLSATLAAGHLSTVTAMLGLRLGESLIVLAHSDAQVRRVEMSSLHLDDRAVYGALAEHRQRCKRGGDVFEKLVTIAGLQWAAGIQDGVELGVGEPDWRHHRRSPVDELMESRLCCDPRSLL